MISRFLILGKMPELRLEPQGSEEEKPAPELEVALRVEQYWDLSYLMKEFKYAALTGQSTAGVWKKIAKIVIPCIVSERDRIWFAKQNQR